MKEARAGQIIVIKTEEDSLEGLIESVEEDRITVNYFKRDRDAFKALLEGEVLRVIVHTKFGIKRMKSILIDNSGPRLVIENARTIERKENREDVRTSVQMKIYVKLGMSLIPATTINLSAGGVKFELNSAQVPLNVDDEVEIKFTDNTLEKDLSIGAVVTKSSSQKIFVACFSEKNQGKRSKISGFCMRNTD